MKTKIISLLLILFALNSFGQKKRKYNEIEYINSLQLTGGFGSGTYFGDLCDNFECAVFRPTSSIGLIYRNSDRLLFRTELHYVMLYGTDADGDNRSRNLHFKSNSYEFMFSGIYDFFPYERRFRYRSYYTPYGHFGIGATYFTPKAELNGKWYNLRKLETEGKRYSTVTPTVSYGIGVRWKVTSKLNISTEAGYRWTFTDYLDDVSTTYVDNSSLESEEAKILADRTDEADLNWTIQDRDFDQTTQTWREGHQRGNPKRKDGYFLFEFKAEYRLMWTTQGGSVLRKAKFR